MPTVTPRSTKRDGPGPSVGASSRARLRQTPRTAAVVASTGADVWEIPRGDFLATLNEIALPPTALLEGMTARLAELAEVDAANDVNRSWHADEGDDDPRR